MGVGGRGCLLIVIGVFVLIALGESRGLHDPCCFEDWVKVIPPVLAAWKAKFETPAQKEAIKHWKSQEFGMMDDEPEGVCQGKLSLKCVPTGVPKQADCKCNSDKPFDFVVDSMNMSCVGKEVGSFCYNGTNKSPCNVGLMCEETNKDFKTGLCVMKIGDGGNLGGNVGARPQSPVTWVFLIASTLMSLAASSVVGLEVGARGRSEGLSPSN